jgi:hypothetical protein
VVGQGFVQIVADVPSQGEAVGHHLHELSLASQVLKEKHKLEQNPLNTMPPLR